jgi:hypothetical protein
MTKTMIFNSNEPGEQHMKLSKISLLLAGGLLLGCVAGNHGAQAGFWSSVKSKASKVGNYVSEGAQKANDAVNTGVQKAQEAQQGVQNAEGTASATVAGVGQAANTLECTTKCGAGNACSTVEEVQQCLSYCGGAQNIPSACSENANYYINQTDGCPTDADAEVLGVAGCSSS